MHTSLVRTRAPWVARALLSPALLIAACADPSPFSEKQIAAGIKLAPLMLEARLKVAVENIYNARINDPDRDAVSFRDWCGDRDDCVFSHKATARLVTDFWKSQELGLQVAPTVETTVESGFENTNIAVELRGAKRPQEVIVLCGHYDAWFGGANDNGTGVAILMEAARALKDARLDRTVRLVLFDGEELGGVGSYRYQRAHSLDEVRIAINLDMLGHFVGRKKEWILGDPERFDFLVNTNDTSNADAFKVAQLAKRLPRPARLWMVSSPGNGLSSLAMAGQMGGGSDHLMFWFKDVPSLSFFPTGEMTEDYHSPKDTPDTIHYDRLEMIAQLAIAAAAAFATEEN